MPVASIPCYVINLASDVARRSHMQSKLDALDIAPVYFDAVDGRVMGAAELERHVDQAKLRVEYGVLTSGEVGCALSHIGIYREIIREGHQFAAILEDDVCMSEGFGSFLDPSSDAYVGKFLSRTAPEMLQLTGVSRGYRFTERDLGLGWTAIRPSSDVWLASGYIINLQGAKSLAENLYPLWTVADQWSRFQQKGLIGLWALTKPAVWQSVDAEISNLSSDRRPRIRGHKNPIQRLRRLGFDMVRPVLTRKL